MHSQRIGTVCINDVFSRDPLAEVCLEAVDAHVEKLFKLILIPFSSIRISEIHDAHSCLPEIRLPDAAVGLLNEIAVCCRLIEDLGLLRDIRIYPDADMKASCVKLCDEACRIREHVAVPEEVAPVRILHPETVEMEHGKVDAPVTHSVDE